MENLAGGEVFPQGLKPTIIWLKVMYGLKPVPFVLPVGKKNSALAQEDRRKIASKIIIAAEMLS